MDSTSTLDTISSSQAAKETTANALFNAQALSGMFSNRLSTTAGLTWGYYGTASRLYVNATATTKANGTIAITTAATRYLSFDRAFTPTEVTSAFPPAGFAAYKIVAGASTLTSWEDHRDPHHLNRFLYGRFVQAMADANKTLTYEQAMCESMELTGALTALRDVIVPLVPRCWTIYANTTGGFGVRIIAASGTGITVADTKRAIVECDGTNVVRITADV